MQNQVQTFASRQPHCLLLGPHSLTLSPRNIPFAGIKQDLPVLICSTIVGNFSIMRVHLVGALCSSCAFCRVSPASGPSHHLSALHFCKESLSVCSPLDFSVCDSHPHTVPSRQFTPDHPQHENSATGRHSSYQHLQTCYKPHLCKRSNNILEALQFSLCEYLSTDKTQGELVAALGSGSGLCAELHRLTQSRACAEPTKELHVHPWPGSALKGQLSERGDPRSGAAPRSPHPISQPSRSWQEERDPVHNFFKHPGRRIPVLARECR